MFDRQDLLRQSAYSEGDIIPVFSIDGATAASQSTTSTTFVQVPAKGDAFVEWDEFVPDGAQGVAKYTADLFTGAGEEMFVDLYNVSDGEQVAGPVSTTSNARLSTGWVEYTPSDTTIIRQYRPRHRTEPGSNSSTTADGHVLFGVKL